MKKSLLVVFCVFFTFIFNLGAQEWKRDAQALFIGTGTNNYMGDLGGGKKDAAHFLGLRDWDYQSTRPTFQFGYRLRVADPIAIKVFSSYAIISGNDAASGHIGRRARNLSFRSPVVELGGQIEYFFLREKVTPRYAFASLGGFRNIAAYLFFGFGGFYYNPKAKNLEDGKWYALRPLGTEGQYADITYNNFYDQTEVLHTPKPYSPFASFISMGIGAKYNINRQWAVGVEFSNRYTSTDYLDDAHDRYFNYDDFPELSYPDGVDPDIWHYFADRHLLPDYENNTIVGPAPEAYHSGKPGRGNPEYNDAYLFFLVHVYYTIKKNSSYRRPKFR